LIRSHVNWKLQARIEFDNRRWLLVVFSPSHSPPDCDFRGPICLSLDCNCGILPSKYFSASPFDLSRGLFGAARGLSSQRQQEILGTLLEKSWKSPEVQRHLSTKLSSLRSTWMRSREKAREGNKKAVT
jgi:hypothetical protein